MDMTERIDLLEQQAQVGAWSRDMNQSDLIMQLQSKVNKQEDEFNTLNKRLNEFKAYQSLGSSQQAAGQTENSNITTMGKDI